MAEKSVAVEGDVVATSGTQEFTGADKGKGQWTPGSITVQTYELLTVMKRKVIYQASCTFSFAGTKSTPAGEVSIAGTETVELAAKTTLLMNGKSKVLVDGDSQTGKFGNKLAVQSSTTKLKTS